MNAERILDFFRTRSRAYKLVFSRTMPASRTVLADLEQFCKANDTTMRSNDPYELARNEGRRQVWLRIQRALNLSPEEQYALLNTKDIQS